MCLDFKNELLFSHPRKGLKYMQSSKEALGTNV